MKNALAQGTMTIKLEIESNAPAMARGCILEHLFTLHNGKLVGCGQEPRLHSKTSLGRLLQLHSVLLDAVIIKGWVGKKEFKARNETGEMFSQRPRGEQRVQCQYYQEKPDLPQAFDSQRLKKDLEPDTRIKRS